MGSNLIGAQIFSGHHARVTLFHISHNNCLFGRLFKVKNHGSFLFGISFFVLEIFKFLYYANALIFLEIFLIQYFIVLVERSLTSSLSSFA